MMVAAGRPLIRSKTSDRRRQAGHKTLQRQPSMMTPVKTAHLFRLTRISRNGDNRSLGRARDRVAGAGVSVAVVDGFKARIFFPAASVHDRPARRRRRTGSVVKTPATPAPSLTRKHRRSLRTGLRIGLGQPSLLPPPSNCAGAGAVSPTAIANQRSSPLRVAR